MRVAGGEREAKVSRQSTEPLFELADAVRAMIERQERMERVLGDVVMARSMGSEVLRHADHRLCPPELCLRCRVEGLWRELRCSVSQGSEGG